MLKKPHMLIGITLLPLLICTIVLYISLSGILRKELQFQCDQVVDSQRQKIVSNLKSRIETAWQIADYYYRENLGREACEKVLDTIRFDENNYIWVHQLNDSNVDSAVMLVHPNKQLVGKDLIDIIDLQLVNQIYLNGNIYPLNSPETKSVHPLQLFKKFNEVCLAQGDGVVEYYWPKIVDGNPGDIGYLKMSYVKYFPEWNWVLGCGAYADYIDHLVAEQRQAVQAHLSKEWRIIAFSLLCVAGTLGLIAFFVSGAISKQIIRHQQFMAIAQRRLSDEMERTQKNERIFKTLIANLPQRVVLKDNNLHIVYCNQKYADVLGLNVEGVVGKTDYDLYPTEIADKQAASDRDVLGLNRTIEEFSRSTGKDGEVVTRILKTTVRKEDGQTEGVLCVFEDFTERVKAEENLKNANSALAKTNYQLKEMQSQLVQSEKLASIGQLAAGIAHEINNPMCFVMGNFNTLEKYLNGLLRIIKIYDQHLLQVVHSEKSLSADHAKEIQAAREELKIDYICQDVPELLIDATEGMNRVVNIVEGLRSFSRIDQPESFAYFDLNEGVRSTLTVSQSETRYDVNVKLQLSEIPLIYCNSGQINQVILNMLVNASQAIKSQKRPEPGNIEIRTYTEGEYVVLEIRDDGPGIPKEILPRIFDPFFTTKPVGEGTGLGLNIAYDIIVNKHQGSLLVESEVGKGADFFLKLPIHRQDETEERKEEHEDEHRVVC